MSQKRVNPPRRIKWTKQQSRAIAEHGRNVFVSASAGTGKTAVLSGSCVDVITNTAACPDVWSILVVTFTDMAAEEMRSRIARQLTSAIDAAKDPADRRRLGRQLILLGAADISTIHSFCKRLITEHFHRLDLDPTFGVLDADEAKLLKTETLEKTIDWAWNQDNLAGALRQLLSRRDLRMMEGFPGTIIEISDFLDGIVSRDDWFERAKVLSQATDPFATDLAQAQKQIIAEKLENVVSQIRHAEKIYNAAVVNDKNTKFESLYIKPIAELLHLLKDGNWARFNESIRNYRKPRVETPEGIDKEFAGFIQKAVKKAVDSVENVRDLAILNPEYLDRFAGAVGSQTMVLVELVKRFDYLYGQARKSINCLDFADLEHYALRLLTARQTANGKLEPSETALAMRKKYKYVFVDEYQDINGVQQAIIDMVGSPGGVFAVGDPKQSIYRWRGARPEIFIEHLGRASTEPKSNDAGLRVDLNVNFRSVRPILDFVNKVFGRIMTASFAGIDYDESAYLRPHSENIPQAAPSPAVEIHILDEAQTDSDASPFNSRQLQAAMIAGRIKQIVGIDESARPLQILDKQTGLARPADYRDIVILMRSLAGKNEFLEALRLAGIPVRCDAAAGYFETTEITDMLCLLKVLDNPRRDIELAAVLRCPFFDFTDTELAMVRLRGKKENRETDFYDCLLGLCRSSDDRDLADKISRTLAKLDEWRTTARHGRLAELVWHIYRQTGFLSFVCALPDGPARRANLLKLHDRAIQFEAFAGGSNVPSLARFIDFIEKLVAAGEDWSSAEPQSAAGNAVRVLSVHKSKGLEFPVVFIADLDGPFSKKDSRRDCLVDEQSTIGLRIINPDGSSRLDSLAYQVIEDHARKKSLAEEMRILYVAMTRAMDRLILVGCKDKTTCQRILAVASVFDDQPIPPWHLETCQCHLDWILSALAGVPLLQHAFQDDRSIQSAGDRLFDIRLYDQQELEKLSALIQNSKPTRSVVLSEADSSSAESKDLVTADIAHLKDSLNWQYSFGDAPLLPAKRTVTQWTHRNDEFARVDYSLSLSRKPKAVLSTGHIDGRSVGSATHLVLSRLDLAKPITTESITRLIDKLVADGVITPHIASQVDAESIVKFFESDLGQMALDKNNSVLREWPFTFALPASQWCDSEKGYLAPRFIGGLPTAGGHIVETSNDFIIVQGIIDLLIKTPQGLLVIDFKTDDVSAVDAPGRAELYRTQLALYAQAASSIIGQKILAKYLYFLALDSSSLEL